MGERDKACWVAEKVTRGERGTRASLRVGQQRGKGKNACWVWCVCVCVCVRAVRVGRKERTLAGLGVCVCV